MNLRALSRVFTLSPYLFAVSSVVATRVFSQYALSEVLAVVAFVCGLALWRADRSTDRLIAVGAALGIGGWALKGIFVWLGIGAEAHDMATHETTPGNPLLLHIHHLFFNIGFLFFVAAAIRATVKNWRGNATMTLLTTFFTSALFTLGSWASSSPIGLSPDRWRSIV